MGYRFAQVYITTMCLLYVHLRWSSSSSVLSDRIGYDKGGRRGGGGRYGGSGILLQGYPYPMEVVALLT